MANLLKKEATKSNSSHACSTKLLLLHLLIDFLLPISHFYLLRTRGEILNYGSLVARKERRYCFEKRPILSRVTVFGISFLPFSNSDFRPSSASTTTRYFEWAWSRAEATDLRVIGHGLSFKTAAEPCRGGKIYRANCKIAIFFFFQKGCSFTFCFKRYL